MYERCEENLPLIFVPNSRGNIALTYYFINLFFQPKEKRAELSKHIQQRKRKSLSDLFKMLASLGMIEVTSCNYTTKMKRFQLHYKIVPPLTYLLNKNKSLKQEVFLSFSCKG